MLKLFTLSVLAALPATAAEPVLDFDCGLAAERAIGATLAERAALAVGAPAPLALPLPDKGGIPEVPPPWPAYPGGGQPGGQGQPVDPNVGPPFSQDKPFAAAVYLHAGTVNQEMFTGTGRDVTIKLAGTLFTSFVNGALESDMVLQFPRQMHAAKVRAGLVELEKSVIEGVGQIMQEQLKRMMPMANTPQAQKEKMLRIIAEDERLLSRWREEAREEAEGNSNWRLVAENTVSFRHGPAYHQLNKALLGREYMQGIFRHK